MTSCRLLGPGHRCVLVKTLRQPGSHAPRGLPELRRLGFTDEQIITMLEMRMECAVGKRGRCNIGHTCICLDGPVFTYAQLRQLPPEF